MNKRNINPKKRPKILLMGNPNVGKSVVFWRLTGLDAVSSNFPGTTVEYTKGKTVLAGKKFTLTDVPGAYSLKPSNKAEEVASQIIKSKDYDLILHIIDSVNLERNLFFALQTINTGKPIILLLNKWDLAKLKGIDIDCEKLSQKLGVKVVPFVAVTGEGIKEVENSVKNILERGYKKDVLLPPSDNERWKFIGDLSKKVQTITHKHPTIIERLAEISISPITGMLTALAVLIASFFVVKFLGEGLTNYILEPVYQTIYLPFVEFLASYIKVDFLKAILLGSGAGQVSEFGVLTEGVHIALVTVLPYIFAFYLIMSFLEDLGYLPRLAVLLDRFLHKMGLHGYASIPMILGLGCKVPAILAVRSLENRRQRITALTMTLLIAPCMPQSALIFAILAKQGMQYVFYVFITLFITSVIAGIVLNRLLKGERHELFVEIPPWHLPNIKTLLFKLKFRIKSYVFEAVPLIILGVLLINVGQLLGLAEILVKFFHYPVTLILGLPDESVPAIILGFLRKDVSIAMLTPFGLSAGQLVIGSVFLSMYLPCAASFFMMIKEAGLKDTLKIVIYNLTLAVLVCAVLNAVYKLF